MGYINLKLGSVYKKNNNKNNTHIHTFSVSANIQMFNNSP